MITRVIAINDWLYQGDCIMRISRFASALALSLGLTVMPTILVAESGPANTAANNLHTKRHAGHARCRLPASGVPPAAERSLIRAFAQSTSATIELGVSRDFASNPSARQKLAK